MSELTILLVLYAVGVLMLVAEIFIPSHGVLSLAGIGFLVAAVVKTFSFGGREAGVAAILGCMVFVPTFAFLAIKYWPSTPIGKLISPPNPVLTSADTSVPVVQLSLLVGQEGRAVSPLRPVGVCDFDGRRVSCVAEMGMIGAGTIVKGTGIKGSNLVVAQEQV